MEEQEVKPTWRDNIKGRFPDREFADDEAYGSAADELIQSLSTENADYKGRDNKVTEANKKLVEIMEADTRIADFLADIMKGASPEIAIARNFDLEAMTPQEGEPDYEAWKTELDARKSRKEEAGKLEEEVIANKIESSKVYDDFILAKGLTPEQDDAFIDKIEAFLVDINRGKVTTDFLEAMYKATNYESDINSVKQEAEASRKAAIIEGKNSAIEEKKVIRPKGDGLPNIGSSSEPEPKPEPVKNPTLAYLDRLNKNVKP